MRHRPRSTAARRIAVAALLASPLAVSGPVATAADGEEAGPTAVTADFNNDGYGDIVATAPHGTVAGKPGAGYVTVVHGSAKGADTAKRQVISQATAGVPGEPTEDGGFGYRTVARDLDGDGCDDLAIDTGYASEVTVLWGSTDGKGGAATLPGIGRNVTAGDFNGDGHTDLVSDAKDGEEPQLHVAYGPFTRAGQPASTGTINTGRTFNSVDLVAGDVTGDGKDDLVSFHAFEEMSEGSQLWRGTAEGLNSKATALPAAAAGTVGDVDNDGYGDLVFRPVPNGVVEDLPYDKGTVKVLYGAAGGPGTRSTTLTQDSAGVPGVGEEGDQFGYTLSAGDVNGDGYADVAVGIPFEDLTSSSGRALKDAGSTVLLKGGKGGLSGAGSQAFTQDTPGVPGVAEPGDRHGEALALLDTNGDGKADLTTGAPGEDGTTLKDTGAAWSLLGSPTGLTTTGAVSYGPGTLGGPESGAALGSGFPR